MKMFFVSLLLMLSWSGPQQAVASADSSISSNSLRVSVVLSSAEVRTGDLIAYRASLTNLGKQSVEIPADTMKFMQVVGDYAAPSEMLPLRPETQTGEGKVRSKTRWQTLLPGKSVHIDGTFKDVFEQCVRGCKSGSYRLFVSLDVPRNEEVKLGQVIPRPSHAMTEARVIPLRKARGTTGIELQLSNPMWRSPRRLDFQGTLRNTTNRPVWIPNPDKLPLTCRFRVVTPTQTVFMRHAPVTRVVSRYSEKDGMLLHGGDETYFTYQCRGVHEESILKARKVFVGAEVTFSREFYPVTHVEHTDYLKGRLRGAEVQVK